MMPALYMPNVQGQKPQTNSFLARLDRAQSALYIILGETRGTSAGGA